jgi:putative inorganic carbon (HCO3(-)) transporter
MSLAKFICRNAHWFVIPVAILLLFPSFWMGLGFIATPVLYLARGIAKTSPVPASRVNLLILILLAMTAFGFALSPAPDLAVLTAGQVVASTMIFFVLSDRIESPTDLWRVAAVLVALGVLLALATPFIVIWSPNKLFGLPEIYDQVWPRLPEVANPNITAGGIAPIVLVALALVAQDERRWRVFGAVALAPLGFMLVLLQSRGALFGLAIGLAAWATLYRRWLLPFIPLLALGVLALNETVGGPPPAEFVYGQVGTSTSRSLVSRQEIWMQGLYLVRESPLVGIGLGAYPRVAPYVLPHSVDQPGSSQPHVHDLFLQIALDTGIVGLAAFVVLLALAFRSAWYAYHARIERHLAIGVLSALVAVIAHGVGDTIVWGTAKPSVFLWILLCLAFGFEKIREA